MRPKFGRFMNMMNQVVATEDLRQPCDKSATEGGENRTAPLRLAPPRW
jgi:hypothetical protein